MEVQLTTSLDKVNWEEVAEILNSAGLSEYDAKGQEKIFSGSYLCVFAFDGDHVVGCGRAISDGVCQAAIYNIALKEGYRHQGLGSRIMNTLLQGLSGQSVILYTNPAGVSYYERFGFSRAKTAMCMYRGPKEKVEHMKASGFILPEGFRFDDEIKESGS